MIAQKTRWLVQVLGVVVIFALCLSLHPTPSIFGKVLIETATNQLQNALQQIELGEDSISLVQMKHQAQQVLDQLGGNLIAENADIPLNDGSVRHYLIDFWEQQSIELVQLVNRYGPHGEVSVSHQQLMMVVNTVLIRLGQAEHFAQMTLLTKDAEAAKRYLQNLQTTLQSAIGGQKNLNEAGAAFVEATFNRIAHLSQSQWPSMFQPAQRSHQVASE